MTPEELEQEATELDGQAQIAMLNHHRAQAAAITKRDLAKRLRDEAAKKDTEKTG